MMRIGFDAGDEHGKIERELNKEGDRCIPEGAVVDDELSSGDTGGRR